MAAPQDPTLKRLWKLRRFYLRRNRRKKAFWALRLIRHRRKVLRVRKSTPHGLVWFDGRQISSWIEPFLTAARHGTKWGRWHGYVTSGYRSYAKQAALYYGAPGNGLIRGVTVAAPGTSNHNYIEYPKGAVDCTDYVTLDRITDHLVIGGRQLQWYRDVLTGHDYVHFSASGH